MLKSEYFPLFSKVMTGVFFVLLLVAQLFLAILFVANMNIDFESTFIISAIVSTIFYFTAAMLAVLGSLFVFKKTINYEVEGVPAIAFLLISIPLYIIANYAYFFPNPTKLFSLIYNDWQAIVLLVLNYMGSVFGGVLAGELSQKIKRSL